MADLTGLSGTGRAMRLSEATVGDTGVIVEVRAKDDGGAHGVSGDELQRRLLEFGFVEGARFEVLHEGLIRHDPIAVRVDETRVALRRRDASEVLVRVEDRRK